MNASRSEHALPPEDEPGRQAFFEHVHEGLSAEQKWLSPKYFYDAEGSRLFNRICELPEYYLTRTELQIMAQHLEGIAGALGPRVLLIEPGSGSGVKTRRLLGALDAPAGYVPVEISREQLMQAVERLRSEFPAIPILPVCADFTAGFDIPRPEATPRRRVVYFPGSTIGNFDAEAAANLLRGMRDKVGAGGGLLIGVDLRKDRQMLENAYNDSEGITAQFNLNLLKRINRELGGDFDVDGFSHRAIWNSEASRVEMHLVSRRDQTVRVGDSRFRFAAGEYIFTESSYKFTLAGFAARAEQAGWSVSEVWTDARQWFSVQYLETASGEWAH